MNDNKDVNQKNIDEFNKVMENAKIKTDGYFDRNNPIVKIILVILLIISIIGSLYYIIPWFINK